MTPATTCTACGTRTHDHCLGAEHPELAAEALGWDPWTIGSGSRANLPWRCSDCGTEWSAEVRIRVRGQRPCPTCSRKSRPPLSVTHPDLAAEMLPPFDPAEVTHGSKLRVRWRGPLGHEWEAPVANRVRGSGCPVCAHGAGARARQQPEPGGSLADTHPAVASEADGWDPTTLRPGSNTRQRWACAECGHHWMATVFHRTHGQGCPACARERRRLRTSA